MATRLYLNELQIIKSENISDKLKELAIGENKKEEFIIVMLNIDKIEAINLAERIKNNIYNANIIHEYSKVIDKVTVSIGITTAQIGTNKNYDEYIQRADNTLYEAKSKGKNTYVYIE